MTGIIKNHNQEPVRKNKASAANGVSAMIVSRLLSRNPGAAGGHGTGRLLRRTSLGQVGEEDAEVSPGRRRPGLGHPQLMFSRVEPPCAPVLAQQRDRFVTLSI